ncbi:hypothetical protein HWV62_1983 [Athelia sp. TMB]|nr:hypothetical protein HWV62_1983 [Athelia sp. TMB]
MEPPMALQTTSGSTPVPDETHEAPSALPHAVQSQERSLVAGPHTIVQNAGNKNVINTGRDYVINNNSAIGEETSKKVASIEERLQVVCDKAFRVEVHGWLAAPAVSQNFNAAQKLHLEGTGSWFIEGSEFSSWKESTEHFLGIYGSPGCGKTILCSLIIEEVKELCVSRPLSGCAYFFFDGRSSDQALLLFDNCLLSILSQLARCTGGIPGALKDMYRAHGDGYDRPSPKSLRQTLRRVIAGFDHVYIMIDSLDECRDRDELLQWINEMAEQTDRKLHLLFTSRREPAIVKNLGFIGRLREILMKGSLINNDISRYLDSKLFPTDGRDEETRGLIKSELAKNAEGVFRWVDLQLQQLKKCFTYKKVQEQLKKLPTSLEGSYAKILADADPLEHLQLRNILYWLAFSARALALREIAEVVSVDFEALGSPTFDPKCRYGDPTVVLTVCSGLVTETDGEYHDLAHLSVKEFLMSDNIKAGAVAFFGINERICHSVIAQTCLAYLLNFDKKGSISARTISSFPLAMYAAEHWVTHLLTSEDDTPPLHSMLLRLFSLPRSYALVNWAQIWDIDKIYYWTRTTFQKAVGEIAQPIYYACAVGQIKVVEHLLQSRADPNTLGFYGTPLQAALICNEHKIAKLLLGRGVDVTVQAGRYGTALNIASMSDEYKLRIPKQPLVAISQDITPDYYDHGAASFEMVTMLLARGADPNAHAGHNIPLVSAARFGRHIEIVTLLLDRGADIDAEGEDGTALQQASGNGHLKVVTLLLDRGADIDAEGDDGPALQRASGNGHLEIVTLLLDRGADIKVRGVCSTALQLASLHGHLDIVTLLLDRGADINAQGDRGTALQRASLWGNLETVTLLLDRGADMNARGENGTALQQASLSCDIEVVTLLLDRGADINAQGDGGTALQQASGNGHLETVSLLLDRGADVNAQGDGDTALQRASWRGHLEIVTLLLDRGADIDAQGDGGTALQKASNNGHLEIVTLLLDRGADVNAQGDRSTALQRASWRGLLEIVILLLDRGADVNAQGDRGTALQRASGSGHLEIVTLLLDRGADIDAQGDGGTALQQASENGHLKVVTLLLERGADVNVQAGQFSNALQAASTQCHEELRELLSGLGAGVNARGNLYIDIAHPVTRAKDCFEIMSLLLDRGADVNAETEGCKGNMMTTAVAAIRGVREYLVEIRETMEYFDLQERVVELEAVVRLFLEYSATDLSEGEQSLMEEDAMEEFVDAQEELT